MGLMETFKALTDFFLIMFRFIDSSRGYLAIGQKIRFYETIGKREWLQKDVRGLIASSEKLIFISALTHKYVLNHCGDEIKEHYRLGFE